MYTLIIPVMVVCFMLSFAGEGRAITLGLHDVSFDSPQGPGQNIYGSQGVNFDTTPRPTVVCATATAISYTN